MAIFPGSFLLPLPLGEGWGAGAQPWIWPAALLIALVIDAVAGEPPARVHPVVWIGRYLERIGRRIAPRHDASNPARHLSPFLSGALAWCFGAAIVAAIACILQALCMRCPTWIAALLLGMLLKPLFAWRMLRTEVRCVEVALAQSLDAGRAALSRLVSRDVAQLDETTVRESAIESLAENLNDSLVAPLFWFVVLGLPGAALYRFANTADAMWGYRGERGGRDWTWAGKWAARADDVLSWLPARITAWLFVLGAGMSRRRVAGLRREAGRTASPNSGWPMAAMALLLDVRLAKPGVYALHAAGREAQPRDLHRSIVLGNRAVLLATGIAAACLCFASAGTR